MKTYHFLTTDFSTRGDEPPWKVGETRTIADTSRIELCKYGYHSSPSLWNALEYAIGPGACLVEISEPIQQDETKYVSASRTLLKAVNIDSALRLFACDCAERVLHLYERTYPQDMRLRNCINTSRRFALGRATEEERAFATVDARAAAANAAARPATRDAMRDAESVAARDAAWAAVRPAANAATWNAARAATWNAANAATWAATWAAARNAANAATWAATWAAVRPAEVQWQCQHFDTMFKHIFDQSNELSETQRQGDI